MRENETEVRMRLISLLTTMKCTVQDENGAAGAEEDPVAAEQVENAGAAEHTGESVGAAGRQENVREPEVNVGGAASERAGAPETNHPPRVTSSRRSADAKATNQRRRQWMVPQMPSNYYPGIDPRAFISQHQRYVGAYPIHAELPVPDSQRRQRMVPQMPSDYPGIDPRAFRPQHQRYVGAYPVHVELPVPDSRKRKGTGRQGDKAKRARRKCLTCGQSDCNGAKTRVKDGESRACQYRPVPVVSVTPVSVWI
jgi:hypothetical protein